MSVLDKKLLIADLKTVLDDYIPANTAERIITDLGEILSRYEVTTVGPDGGGGENKQILSLFIDAKKIEGKASSTVKRYQYILQRMLECVRVSYNKITVYHMRAFIREEQERGVSLNTIKGNVSIYHNFFSWLRDEGVIDRDPTSALGNIKARAEESIPFTAEEIQLIKEAAKTDLQRAVIHFLLTTGCRVSELCSVNRNDIDFHSLSLRVTGKGSKVRTVYIDDVTAMMLKRYLSKRADGDPALFRGERGRYTAGGIRQLLKGIECRSGVSNVHPHRFRHTLATNLVDRGMSVQEVAAILGHAKLDTTMTYVYVNQRNTENSFRKYACM